MSPAYPVPYDPSDDRLDDQLVGLAGDLIVYRTGYPYIDGPDLDRLREALHWFLYGPIEPVDERLSEPEGGPIPPGVEGHRETGRDGGVR
jgi:hypothetical protein